jgi:amidophosphoribosyltransferase
MCGIIGAFGKTNVAGLVVQGLSALQHRGQESWGILTYEGKDGQRFHSHRANGFVEADAGTITRLKGLASIGHVRYSTAGGNNLRNAQPFFGETRFGGIGIAHNGNLINTEEIRMSHLKGGSIYQSTSDTEVILHLLSQSKKDTLADCLSDALSRMKGAYSLVLLSEEGYIIGARDPHGFHPLSIGKRDGCYMLASETCVWNEIDAEFVREIRPGEMVIVYPKRIQSSFPHAVSKCAHCIFEQIYFARPDSMIDDLLVSASRYRIGKILAAESPVEADFVSPVPESGVASAEGFSKISGLRLKRGLIRKRSYNARTFIQPSEALRQEGVRRKYCPDPAVLAGKKVVVVDDSIVRGTTFRLLVEMLREAGAAEVHIRVASPPFKCHCRYGIDTPSDNELLASKMDIEQMRKYFNADSLAFISLEGLHRALGEDKFPEETRFCNACFTGNYPVT